MLTEPYVVSNPDLYDETLLKEAVTQEEDGVTSFGVFPETIRGNFHKEPGQCQLDGSYAPRAARSGLDG